MEEKKPKDVLLKVNPELGSRIEEAARSLKITKEALIEKLLDNFTQRSGDGNTLQSPLARNLEAIKAIRSVAGQGSNPLDMLTYLLALDTFKRDQYNYQPDPESRMIERLMNKVLIMKLVDSLLPEKKEDREDLLKILLANQTDIQHTVIAALLGKSDVKEEIEKLKHEMKLKEAEKEKEFLYSRLEAMSAMAPKLQKLEEELAEIKKGNTPNRSLTEELKQYQELRNAILEFAKQEGLSAPKEGEKINWSELLKELLGFGKEAVKKLPTSPEPKPKEVTPITPEQIQQMQLQQTPKIEELPKEPPKKDLFDELPKAPINPPKE